MRKDEFFHVEDRAMTFCFAFAYFDFLFCFWGEMFFPIMK